MQASLWILAGVGLSVGFGASWTLGLSEITHILLIVGMGLVVASWAVLRGRRTPLERAITVGAGMLVVVSALHAATGATALFGFWDTWITPPQRFFAPFLNGNHLAAALLLAWPVLLGQAFRPDRLRSDRLAALALALAALAVVAWTGSTGGLVAAGIVAIGAAVYVEWIRWPWLVLLGVAGIGAVVAFDPLGDHGRLDMWQATLALWLDHPLTGSGGGTFDQAVGRYRVDTAFLQWHHAHNDALEWVAETGLLGVGALGMAAYALWPRLRSAWRGSHGSRRAGWVFLGLGAVALHSLVEFPFRCRPSRWDGRRCWGT